MRISEHQGAMLAKVVEATFADLELNEAQKARGRALVARHLRALLAHGPNSLSPVDPSDGTSIVWFGLSLGPSIDYLR